MSQGRRFSKCQHTRASNTIEADDRHEGEYQ